MGISILNYCPSSLVSGSGIWSIAHGFGATVLDFGVDNKFWAIGCIFFKGVANFERRTRISEIIVSH